MIEDCIPYVVAFLSSLALTLLLTLLPGVSAISLPVRQEAGEMTSGDWIRSSEAVTINSTSFFRKEYTLASKPTALTIRASAHNHYQYYVNGKRISGLVSPAPSVPPEAVLYLTYSFTGAELDELLGGDGTKLKKSVYARGYCMGIGYEPEGGVTTLEIPKSELPAGKRLIVVVRPCSSLATRGKPITTTLRV